MKWWIENLLRPVLIAAMVVCLAMPSVRVIEWMLAGWDGTYFLVFLFLAGLEGILSERALRARRTTGYAYLASRGAELLILLILLKLANYVPLGFSRLWADALSWKSNLDLLVSPTDLITAMLFLPLWGGSIYVARMARELDAEEASGPPPPDKTSAEYYLWLTQPSPVRQSQEALEWLGQTWLWGGIVLLLASLALSVIAPEAGGIEVPILLYFGLGLALMTQGRFSVTHTGWRIQGLAVQPNIGRRWLLWTAVFLASVSLVALLLPTQYAMGPVRAIIGFFTLVFSVISFALTFLWFLLLLPLSFLFPRVQPPERPTLPPALPSPGALAGQATTRPWLQVVASTVFWLLLVAIVAYAVLRFVRDRWGGAAAEDAGPSWWLRFAAWLREVWRNWRRWGQGIQTQIQRRLVRSSVAGGGGPDRGRFFSLRRLAPRELVRYFYLSTVRRALAAGIPRAAGQTPYEYREELARSVPDLEPDVGGLTDAFVQARYSPRPVEAADAQAVKPLWQRIRAALRRRRPTPS